MASASNSSSPNSSTPGGDTVEVYVDGRTKGSRGSKRSVTRLSKEQLEKKRQNDRESQRNIRRRNKERIASLEAKVKELEEQNDPASVEQLKQRNRELEAENERLRTFELEVQSLRRQMQTTQVQQPIPPIPTTAPRIPTTIDEVVMPNTADGLPTNWELDAAAQAWNGANLDATMGADPLNMQSSESLIPPLNATSNPVQLEDPLNPSLSPVFGYADTAMEDVQQQQLNTAISSWGGAIGPASSAENFPKSDASWASIPAALSQPSRFAAPVNISQPMSTFYENSTCWQRQPSVYAWQISTKIKPPVTFVDQLMIKAIQCQRHIVRTAGIKGEEVIGPYVPNVELLFTGADLSTPEPVSRELPLSLTLQETMNLYSTIVSRRGFAFLAEKLASFLAMYRFVRWQIEPTYETYQGLYPWQRPIQSQHEIPHPAWMDLPPWPKFRDKIIRDQERYGTPEFQVDYASNLNVNWPGSALTTVMMENGQIKISKAMDKHLADINNLTMRKPFGDKYPEFHEVVRIDEI
ncbi:hypothetical protein F5884DRAFT_222535 [Xylogone sp. PMI_703]|nr:hypothetical protein F5884DRAFT_222535 [Xylogone sp. PMI_703]